MIITFGNQKGGVGKSTLCLLLANYLAKMGEKVYVIDSDFQQSLTNQRKKDESLFTENQYPFEIVGIDSTEHEELNALLNYCLSLEHYVLIDLPGTISDDSIIPIILNTDYIICPYMYENKTLESTGTFFQIIKLIKEKVKQENPQLIFVPNRIDPRVGTREEKEAKEIIDKTFEEHGFLTPPINSLASLTRVSSLEITNSQSDAVKNAFDFIVKVIKS